MLVLGWLLTFGLLTWIQLRLALGALWLLMKLVDWAYTAAERIVRAAAGRAPFALDFLAALAAQVALVFGLLAAAPGVLTNIAIWL